MPACVRHLGLLRVRSCVCSRSAREHVRLHLGGSDAEERALQDVRHRYPLGATGTQAWRSAGSEPAQLRARTLGVGGRQALRRRRSLGIPRSEEQTSELQSLMRISYAVFGLKKKNTASSTHNATLDY